jgi:predicted transcriptional regulator
MMSKKLHNELSKRERQIMDVIYRRKSASVKEVLEGIPNPPSYSAVRAMLNILEDKGFLKHKKSGLKYIYYPTISHKRAMSTAVKQLLTTYFNNSIEDAVAAIIEIHNKNAEKIDFDKLVQLIDEARKEE